MIPLLEAKKTVDEGLSLGDLVLVVGGCRVKYEGRAASKLSEGDRLLVIKHDGTFLVHQSTKMAAINYQGPGAIITTELIYDANNPKNRKPVELAICARRTLPNNAKEVIEVHFHSIISASHFPLKDDSALQLFGSEKQLSGLLMQDLHLIEKGMTPLQQESDVRKGTIDILARDAAGRLCAIELKRRVAGLEAVTQLARYVKDLSKRKGETIRGILCAPEITENSLKMLEGEGLEYFRLDYQIGNPSATITGLEKKQKGLGEY